MINSLALSPFDKAMSQLDEIFNSRAREDSRAATYRVDHDPENIILHVELPGLSGDQISVKYHEQTLTIESLPDVLPPGSRYSNLKMAFPVLDELVEDAISAELKNGLLTVRLPLLIRPVRTISVKTA